ncbi:hypothetical protein ACFX16_020220 [Malus domestica]
MIYTSVFTIGHNLKKIPNVDDEGTGNRFHIHPTVTVLNLQPTYAVLKHHGQHYPYCPQHDLTIWKNPNVRQARLIWSTIGVKIRQVDGGDRGIGFGMVSGVERQRIG